MDNMMTPREIVKELNKYIVGQTEAKKAVAIALRNRYRRLQLPKSIQEDITPKNLLMIGSTGVGKTEIARRLARLVKAPFIKVEATKFTEVGYVGNDVQSMIRDLVYQAVHNEKKLYYAKVHDEAVRRANNELVKLLVPAQSKAQQQQTKQQGLNDLMGMFKDLQKGKMPDYSKMNNDAQSPHVSDDVKEKRMNVSQKLNQGLLENDVVKVWVNDPNQAVSPQNNALSQMGINLNDIMPKRKVPRSMKVSEARKVLTRQQADELINTADLYHDAIKKAENSGIIFIDEIDKICGTKAKNQAEVSRQGVQRDLLPLVEGTQVKTKYGLVDTSHILFIAAGAFADSKPSDLMPELQGRFPIRVKLNSLSQDDFVKILTEPKNSLVKQYIALIGTDNIKVTFTIESIREIAKIAYDVNKNTQDIGARRLQTVLEKLLEDLLYEGPDMEMGNITITRKYVDDKVGNLAKNKKWMRFLL
ncbi:ATP-dependent protease ATPase subunit HslU [Acetilactobacillus jinshanensis]|uniref:ATP-dependent protease ATPase subunit HslU n=1 Tax=Acetilactobacillus jinshanensis TaxID=1720083 RepID=A0A4P6ZLA0_9LACO|nr:ATP-dependent protease ATPase subunit HslU [Acetilactobacillus jinshanensis]QBP18020.1 ATP-dependent protease ATPase subunit HslU [Acetilactobacillus jinshanensis]